VRFDEAFVRRLEKLRLVARWKVARGVLGAHRSSRRGTGAELAGHRPYAPGDDWRRIDWNAFRRLERLYVTEREEETERSVVLVLDRSASMAEGGKLELARALVAALAHVALAEGDTARVVAFSGEAAAATPPRRGQGAIFELLRFLEELEAAGRTDVAAACREATRGPGRPGLAVLVTDFLDERPARDALVTLARHGRDAVLVHVVAPTDEACSLDGARRLVDAETGEELVLELDRRAREDYARAFADWTRGLEATARGLGATYVRVRSDQPLETVALSVLARARVLA
jgi:uncharacterized protein (DUF58 family)